MPYDPSKDDEEKDNGGWNSSAPAMDAATSQSPAPSVSVAGQGSRSAGAAQPSQVSPGPSAQGQGGGSGFVNLSTMMGLNRGAGEDMGNGLASGAAAKAHDSAQEAQDVLGKFKGSVEAGTATFDPGSVRVTGNRDADRTAANNLYNQAQGLSYGGPTDWTQAAGFGQLNRDVQGAVSSLNGLQTQGGIQGALQGKFNNGAAQSGLDALLVGGNNQAIGNVESQYNAPANADGTPNPYTRLSDLLGVLGGQAGGYVTDAEGASEKARRDELAAAQSLSDTAAGEHPHFSAPPPRQLPPDIGPNGKPVPPDDPGDGLPHQWHGHGRLGPGPETVGPGGQDPGGGYLNLSSLLGYGGRYGR